MADYVESEFRFKWNSDTPKYLQNFWQSGEAIKKRQLNSIFDESAYLFNDHMCVIVSDMGNDEMYLTLIKKAEQNVPPSVAGLLMSAEDAKLLEEKISNLHPAQAYARQPHEDGFEQALGPLMEGIDEEWYRAKKLQVAYTPSRK